MESTRLLWFWLCLWLVLVNPLECIKIGISQNANKSSSTTTTTTTTTDTTPTTNALDTATSTAAPETISTPLQTFPPRKNSKTPTTAAPKAGTVAVADSQNATETSLSRQDFSVQYCPCDLQLDLCEINCCCDRDCPAQTLQVFECLESSVPPQLQTRLEDFQYTHGLPTCQIHDGWLCVFRSNTKPPKIQPLSTNYDANLYQKWPNQFNALEEQSQFTAHYKAGQALQLWQPESKQLSNLELPQSFESSSCQLKQELRHLEPMRSNCLVSSAAEAQSQLWTLLNMTSSHQLLAKPHQDLEDQPIQGIGIEICQQLLLQPQLVCSEHSNETQLDIVVDKVELQLMHNYTHILSAKLLLREANELEENEPLWLSYAVSYSTAGDELAKPSSGPLGYLQGAPLLLSRKLPTAQNSSEKHPMLSYFSSNLTQRHEHWLTLCQHSMEQRHAVGFGVDLVQHCQLRELAPILEEHNNHTDYCQGLQAQILTKLLPHNCSQLEDLTEIFVSQLGRPQRDQWLPIELGQLNDQHMPPIQGIYNAEQQSLSCRHMWLSARYEFHIAELTLLDGLAPHQNVLQHARLVLGPRHDLVLDVGDQQLELPLSVSVMFYRTQKQRLNGAHLPILSSGLLILSAFVLLQ